jgi:small conductance mechanosensitive channel
MIDPAFAPLAGALLNIDTSGWPGWAAAIWPDASKWALVIASVALIWLIASLVKLAIVTLGRAVTPKDHKFEGTPWELAASTARFFAFILMMPLPLGLAGYDWRGLVDKYGPGAFAASVILVAAFIAANAISKSLRRFGARAHAQAGADDTLITFAASLIKYIIFAVAIVFALSQLGFPSASLAAVLGAAGLAVGLALQDTLKSVAAGVMLAVFRPFRIGDYVNVAGLEGTITDITPFMTSLRQIDNKVVSITNDKVWGDPLINFTAEPERRLDLYIDISHDDDIDQALDVLRRTANAHDHVLQRETTWAGVHELTSTAVRLRLRAWVATSDVVDLRADLYKMVKQAFDREGLTIPHPQAPAGAPSPAKGAA